MVHRFFTSMVPCYLVWLMSVCAFAQKNTLTYELTQCEDALTAENVQSADYFCQQALLHAQQQKDTLHWAHALILLGDLAYLKYQRDTALQLTLAAEQLLEAYQERAGPFSFSFLLYQNLGVHYSHLGRYDLQLAYYQRAFQLAKQQPQQDCASLAGAYQNMMAAFYQANDLNRAFAYADTSNQLAIACQRYDIVSRNYHNLASIYADIGEYIQAISFQQKSLELVQSSQVKVTGLLNLALYMQAVNRYADAITVLQTAETITRNKEDAASYLNADVISSLANAYFEAGKYEPFLATYQSGIQLFEEALADDQIEVNYYAYTLLLNYYAGYQLVQQEPEETIRYALHSLRIAQEYYPDVAIGSYLLLGEAYEQLADFATAENYFQQAIAQSSGERAFAQSADNPPLEKILGNPMMLELLMRKADLLERYGSACDDAEKWTAAVKTCELADRVIIASRQQVFNRQSKSKLAQLAHQLYSTAITALYRLYAQQNNTQFLEKAFYFSEKDKNLLLTEVLSSRQAIEVAQVPQAVRQAESYLPARISYFKSLLSRTSNDTRQQKIWQDSLFALVSSQRKLMEEMATHQPAYYDLKYSDQLISVETVRQHLLDDQEVMLQYFLTDEYVYLILIDQIKSDFYALPLQSPLAQQIAALLRSGAQQQPDFGALSHQIYQQILAPVAQDIAGKDLVIVADAAIGQVPFAALSVQAVGTGPSKVDHFLLAHHRIRHLYSAQVSYQQIKRKRKAETKGILCIAPDYENTPVWSDSILQEFAKKIQNLPASSDLQPMLHRHFPDQVGDRDGNLTLKRNFIDSAGQYLVIHIATHALLDDGNPEFSRLIFSPQQAQDTFDVCLHAYEIMTMDLQADLVTLSACNTAIGNPNAGDGIAGLGHAFAFAGSANLISTLWPIRDDQAPKLMNRFYAGLSEGLPKAEALRQAKLDFLRNNPPTLHHPHFWAGFMYSGDNRPLPSPKGNAVKYWIAGLLLLLLVTILFWKRRLQTIL